MNLDGILGCCHFFMSYYKILVAVTESPPGVTAPHEYDVYTPWQESVTSSTVIHRVKTDTASIEHRDQSTTSGHPLQEPPEAKVTENLQRQNRDRFNKILRLDLRRSNRERFDLTRDQVCIEKTETAPVQLRAQSTTNGHAHPSPRAIGAKSIKEKNVLIEERVTHPRPTPAHYP